MEVYFVLTFYSRLGSRDIAVWVFTGLLTGYPLNPGSTRDAVTPLSFPQSNQTDYGFQRASYSMGTKVKQLWRDPNHSSPLNYNMHSDNFIFTFVIHGSCRSRWPHGLRRRSSAARLLRLWVLTPLGTWMFVCCECCVLSGRGLCDELITRPEESYRLWHVVVCDQETSKNEETKARYRAVKIQPQWVVTPGKQTNKHSWFIYIPMLSLKSELVYSV